MADAAKPLVIDTHLHFWDLANYTETGWIKSNPLLFRSYLPTDVKPHFDACGVGRGVIVEAGRTHQLNKWWLQLAADHEYIGAVVVGCALEQDDLSGWFDEYSRSPYFAGARTAPAGPSESWPGNAAAQRGLRELARRGLVLDTLVPISAFADLARLARKHPSLRIDVNHCGMPTEDRDGRREWAERLAPLAACENVWMKYSSPLLLMGSGPSVELFRPVTETLLAQFGPGRMLWGTNWPVELRGGTYEDSYRIARECVAGLSESERAAVFGGNAATFYRVR